EKNIITPQQLIEAVEYQESKNLKFGEYALLKGYMTEKDIERIQNEQKRVDMQFGELAVKLNILTSAQIWEILTRQKNDHIFIGEALLQKGFLTPDVLQRELTLFKEDQSQYVAGEIMIPDGAANPEVIKSIVDLTQKMLQRVAYLNVKVGDGFISHNEPQKNFLLISVSMRGNLKYEYAFSSSQEISEVIASGVMGEDVKSEDREGISDGVKEFCNIACGNIIAKLSQQGKSMDISPPQEMLLSSDGYHTVKGRKAVYYPLVSLRGDSTLILIEG
ncbi:MAG: chemotaxis protein CheX, partial [Nitrospirota bacterium]